MQHNLRNLFGAMPPNELPKSVELEGTPDVDIYCPSQAPEDEQLKWYKEPTKFKAQRWNDRAPSFWLQWKLRTNRVWINGKELSPVRSQQISNHSPDGFSWGYGGSGPAQLALAICAELYGAALVYRVYQQFKACFVASWEMEQSFKMTIDLQAFNVEIVIPAMERLKDQMLYELDEAKAELEFLNWLPSNASNTAPDWIAAAIDAGEILSAEKINDHKKQENG